MGQVVKDFLTGLFDDILGALFKIFPSLFILLETLRGLCSVSNYDRFIKKTG